ncbi:hypothetical protein Tco_1467480 [Tanacetum coccineum]
MEKLSFDLNVRKESSGSNEAAQYGGNPMSVSFKIHHGGCFTPIPSRSYVGGQVSYIDVVDIDESCLHDLKEMIVKLGYGVVDLIWQIETDDPFDDLDEVLGYYANTGKEIIVHVGNSPTIKILVDCEMLYETEGVSPMRNFKEVEVDTDNVTEKESVKSDTEENDTSGSDSKDLDYDPKHDELYVDDEHILKDVLVSINNFNFNPESKHDLNIAAVEVHEQDPDVIDYDSFGSDLDDEIDSDEELNLQN